MSDVGVPVAKPRRLAALAWVTLGTQSWLSAAAFDLTIVSFCARRADPNGKASTRCAVANSDRDRAFSKGHIGAAQRAARKSGPVQKTKCGLVYRPYGIDDEGRYR